MAVQVSAQPQGKLSKFSDLAMAGAILTIVAMLIVPLPDWMLDFGIAINLSLSVIIVLLTVYTTEPLQFSVFPSLLLVTTLYRLALNIAATKLILSTAQPGRIIEAFGNVVLGGNFVVGVISFMILIIVQFVVITNGAGRVAEVAARFTLDAMPGKQMSIDADLNAGHISEEQARERRRKIEAEADFYGAMDGASKFVRGDAMAAVLIIIVNIVGGFAIGMLNGQGDALTVMQTYTILTVGEGLVSQIPALLISTATGLMVTRANSSSNVGQAFLGQLFSRSRPVMLAGVLMLGLFMVPGFPKFPLLAVGGVIMGAALTLMRGEKREEQRAVVAARQKAKPAAQTTDDPMRLLAVDTLLLELGSNLVPLALPSEGGDLADRVSAARRQIAMELGIVLPMVRIRDNLQLQAGRYAIKIRDQVVGEHEIVPNHLLAIDSGTVVQEISGVATTEPAFGSQALWIPRVMRERAEMAGYIVAEPAAVIITHLTEIIKQHAHELLTRQETQALIDNLKAQNKVVVEELIPTLMSLGDVQKVLQGLLRERVSIRDLGSIMETLADWAPRTKDIDQLAEYVRANLSRQICKNLADDTGTLTVMVLAPRVEQKLRDNVQSTQTGVMLAVEPSEASRLVASLTREAERIGNQGYAPLLLCSSQIRLALKRLVERNLPSLTVLAYNEVVPKMDVRVAGTVDLSGDNPVEMAA